MLFPELKISPPVIPDRRTRRGKAAEKFEFPREIQPPKLYSAAARRETTIAPPANLAGRAQNGRAYHAAIVRGMIFSAFDKTKVLQADFSAILSHG